MSSAFQPKRATGTEKYIKNTLIINDLFVYNLNCQYESSPVLTGEDLYCGHKFYTYSSVKTKCL